MSRAPLLIFCVLTIRKHLWARPLHLLSQTALPLKSPTGAFIAPLRCANAVQPQNLLRTDEEELCQFDIIPPTTEKQSVPDGERPVVHIAIVCGFFRVRPQGRTLFLFHHGWVSVKTHLPVLFSPWLQRGWFCAVPPSGRTIPPLQGRREQRRHWFWYPVRRSFPCPQRTA